MVLRKSANLSKSRVRFAVAKELSRQRRANQVHPLCPSGHRLVIFKTEEDGWVCSLCSRGFPSGSGFAGCRECDYDVCPRCQKTVCDCGLCVSPEAETCSKCGNPCPGTSEAWHSCEEGEERVVVTVRNAFARTAEERKDGQVTVSLHENATMLDVKEAVVRQLGYGSVADVRLVFEDKNTLVAFQNGERLGGRRMLLSLGLDLSDPVFSRQASGIHTSSTGAFCGTSSVTAEVEDTISLTTFGTSILATKTGSDLSSPLRSLMQDAAVRAVSPATSDNAIPATATGHGTTLEDFRTEQKQGDSPNWKEKTGRSQSEHACVFDAQLATLVERCEGRCSIIESDQLEFRASLNKAFGDIASQQVLLQTQAELLQALGTLQVAGPQAVAGEDGKEGQMAEVAAQLPLSPPSDGPPPQEESAHEPECTIKEFSRAVDGYDTLRSEAVESLLMEAAACRAGCEELRIQADKDRGELDKLSQSIGTLNSELASLQTEVLPQLHEELRTEATASIEREKLPTPADKDREAALHVELYAEIAREADALRSDIAALTKEFQTTRAECERGYVLSAQLDTQLAEQQTKFEAALAAQAFQANVEVAEMRRHLQDGKVAAALIEQAREEKLELELFALRNDFIGEFASFNMALKQLEKKITEQARVEELNATRADLNLEVRERVAACESVAGTAASQATAEVVSVAAAAVAMTESDMSLALALPSARVAECNAMRTERALAASLPQESRCLPLDAEVPKTLDLVGDSTPMVLSCERMATRVGDNQAELAALSRSRDEDAWGNVAEELHIGPLKTPLVIHPSWRFGYCIQVLDP